MNLLSLTLLWCALQTTVLALLTLVLSSRPWRIGGASAPLFGLVGVSVITVCAFLPSSWSWTLGSLERTSLAPPNASRDTNIEAEGQVGNELLQEGGLAIAVEGLESGPTLVAGFLEGLRSTTESSHPGWSINPISAIVFGLFGAGLAIGTVRLLIGWVAMRRLICTSRQVNDEPLLNALAVLQLKIGLETPVGVYESEQLSTAATLGVWRPCILLPIHWREWTEAELNAVLSHELAHIVHGDFAAVLLSQFSIVFHFYHPLVHFLSGRLRMEQELAADSVAARMAGGQDRYIKVLAKLALEHQDRFVGWPASAFLPTRHTFLRRLEMLRDRKLKSAGRIPAGRWFVLAVIGITSVVLVGMKPPPNRAIGQDVGVRVDSKDGSRPGQYELKFVSDDGGLFFAARPNELLASNQLTEIAKQIQELPQVTSFTEELGVSLKDIEQLIVGFDQTMNEPNSVYMRSVKPMGNSTSPRLGKPAKLSGADILESPSGSMCIWKPDAHSLVFGSKRNVERCIQGRQIERKLTETELWKKLMDRPLLIIGESRIARKWVGEMRLEQSPFALIISSLRPILDEAEVFGVAASMKEDFSIEAMAKSTDTKGATIIQETSQAAMVLVRNGLRELGRTLTTQPNTPVLPTEAKTTIESLLSVGSKLADMAKFQIDGTTVRVTTSIKSNMIPVASIAAALGASRKGAVRSLSANNMKQIALAFHNFHDVHRQFPHTTKSPVPGHSQPVSWRVMILPYIEQVALYEAYRFDEPWDGPSNIKLLSKMPAIYRHPSSAPGSTETSYAILTGEQTMFPPSKPSKLAEITDGTSNTIMTVETKSSIPWTKPEDLDYASDKPLPVLGGFADEGFHAGFADGSVRFMSRSTKELMLRALFSARGGEVVNQ